MALVVPTPRQGHWVVVDKPTSWEPQPRQGSWNRIDLPEIIVNQLVRSSGVFNPADILVRLEGVFTPEDALKDFLD